MINEQLYVTNVMLINGDTDASTGDIHFNGDVIIKGNVHYGYSIYAEGSIIIGGNVEAASLTAGMNIELQSGMQGGGKGTIECLGNVSGKFFEQVRITSYNVCYTKLLRNQSVHSCYCLQLHQSLNHTRNYHFCQEHFEGKVVRQHLHEAFQR